MDPAELRRIVAATVQQLRQDEASRTPSGYASGSIARLYSEAMEGAFRAHEGAKGASGAQTVLNSWARAQTRRNKKKTP